MKNLFVLTLLFASIVCRAQDQAKLTEPSLLAAPGARVSTVTEQGDFSEPSIAVNPANPQQLVGAYQVPASIVYSQDGGLSWSKAEGTAPKDYKVSGDVSVAYDATGEAILCYIAFDKLGSENYWAHNATRNGIFIRRSPDGGKSWEPEAHAVLVHANDPGIPFEDKPYVVADTTKSPYSGNLYVGWTHFTLAKSEIYFSRSSDGGRSWSEPIKISTHDGLPRDDNGAVEGFSGAVAPDGTLYAIWSDGNDIAFTTSRDGGKSFAPSRIILRNAPSYFNPQDVYRANGFPQLALGPGKDPRGGTLYVTWSDYRNGDIDIFAASSRNHGKRWSAPVRVNNDALHNGADQFFQWLAVDPVSGAANVIFYDRRADGGAGDNRKTSITLARSTDGGKTFANYAWTSSPFLGHGDFIGDYSGIAAYNGKVYGIWTENPERPEKDKDKKGSHLVVRIGMAVFGGASP